MPLRPSRFQGRIVDFFTGAEAPDTVVTRFADLDRGAPEGMAPEVVAAEARAVRTYVLSDGSATTLWVAPTREGGFCFLVERALGGCRSKVDNAASSDYVVGFGMTGPRGRVPFVISGDIKGAAGVASLTVAFEDGAIAEVELTHVSAPINAAFYLYEVPSERAAVGRRPVELVARQADGNIVDRQVLPTQFGGTARDESK